MGFKTMHIIGEYSNHLLDALRDSENRTKHNPDRWIPKIGDKVTLKKKAYDGLPGKVAAKLAKLPYCTVKDVNQIPMGKNGNYEWYYEIDIEETGYMIGIYYKKYKP